MKISMVGPVYPYRGGIAHYTSLLAEALQRSGHDLQMVSFKRQYPAFLYPGQTDKDPSSAPIRVQAEFLLDPLYPWTWFRTSQAIQASQPDIVLFHWWSTFWAPAYAAVTRLLNKRAIVVFLIHNVLPHETKPWDRWLARAVMSQGTAFIVQAPHEHEKLLGLIPSARVSYCNLPVYERFGDEVIMKETARLKLGLPTDLPLFLFFGIVRPYKGLKYLIEAFAQIGKPAHLAVAGEFWEDITLYMKQVEHLGLEGKVTFLNKYIPNEEAHILFSAADAFVAPYVDGTQSAAAGVSLGYGLPTIVTEKIAAGINREAKGVYVVPAGDAEALAQAMIKFMESPLPSNVIRSSKDDWLQLVRVIEKICDQGIPAKDGN